MKERKYFVPNLNKLENTINITPLVDVLLVLLVVFMVSAPLITHSVGIDLASGKSSNNGDSVAPKTLLIAVDSTKTIYFDDYVFNENDFKHFIKSTSAYHKDSLIYLQLDKNLKHDFLITMMLLMKNAGYHKVGLVYDEK